MIKIDGVDIPRIEYIDPVEGKVSILRVMQDGVQIWPTVSDVINTPTGIQIGEYDILTIDWDYTQMFAGAYNTPTLIEMFIINEDLDLGSFPDQTDFTVKVNNIETPVTGISMYLDYVRLTVADFTSSDEIKVSYTAGTNPLKAITTGNLVPNITDVVLDNVLSQTTIDWDYTQMFAGKNDFDNLLDLYFVNELVDTGATVPALTDMVVKINDVAATTTGITLIGSYIRVSCLPTFTASDEIKVSYTAGANPLKAVTTGNLVPNIVDVVCDNVLI